MYEQYVYVRDHAQRWTRRASVLPAWAWSAAAVVAALVVVIPLLALALTAIVAAGLVLAVAGGVHLLTRGITQLFSGSDPDERAPHGMEPRDDGRRNVRVIVRDD